MGQKEAGTLTLCHWVYEQWGTRPKQQMTWTFPIAFHTNCYFATYCGHRGGSTANAWHYYNNLTTTKVDFLYVEDIGLCLAIGK